jgi:hypothetical protein
MTAEQLISRLVEIADDASVATHNRIRALEVIHRSPYRITSAIIAGFNTARAVSRVTQIATGNRGGTPYWSG